MADKELHRGLDGIAVAETRLSGIDGAAGELVIGGFPVEELAGNASYEESVFLLFDDRLPTEPELESFRAELAGYREIPEEVEQVLRRAAREDRDAMDALRMGVAAADLGLDATDPTEVATRLVSVLPTIVATYWRCRSGREPVRPRADLGHAANYLWMLTGDEPDPAAVRGLETYLNTVVDHGLNASTFVARSVVSTESDLVSAVTGAVGSLKGPLHGGAPGPVLEMLLAVHETGDAEGYVRETLASGERLMGFGHRVYRTRDPRAAVLSRAAERFYADSDERAFFETVEAFEEVAVALLSEHKPDRALETNVEFYTAALLHGVGIPRELFTATFAVSRVGGWTAHCLEQRADNKLIRPVSVYVGDRDRSWKPANER
ncbi:citrate synthase/methylcitrate synthase [Salinigranum rubrum]|uniref:Citrate synthase n=1 Tax=Salinigranum rubrum TaxID=755307 RepID=A0A2I8VLG5_9EURY|nr:citrate synthase/methylcitrate synthase [Salinigranum rubrum]AUV82777.1 citrate synthase/methylcitrate synthase [Salinigranum rubrum]